MEKHSHSDLSKLTLTGVIVTLGIIYGDIGTSPLYVLKAILFSATEINEMLILGALSCIIWTLTLQTTVKYVIITLRADNKGEGGIFSLFTLLRKRRRWLTTFAIIGGSTLLADGIITPSITVTSAVEGLKLFNPDIPVIPIVIIIITGLFFVQQFGTSFVGKAFGPIMLVWFTTLGVLGFVSLMEFPMILKSFNPYYAYNLLANYPKGILLLGAVFLCTTGAEALYTDLGHCGLKNIRTTWGFVKVMLILNYLGQGAWVLNHINQLTVETNPFYSVMPQWFLPFGIILATTAAVVASQALITGSYTLISEAISLNFWPKIRIKYPSHAKGQMYVPTINWLLFMSCCFVILLFQTSANMEAAYGLSITITMLMTSILMVFYLRSRRIPILIIVTFAAVYFTIEGAFLVANMDKFTHGGWFTVVAASFISLIMVIMHRGRQIRNRYISFLKIDRYLPIISDVSQDSTIPKYSSNLVYTTHADKRTDIEEKTIYSILKRQPKRADVYWILHVDILDDPSTLEYKVTELYAKRIYRIDFYLGFKVQPKIAEYFSQVLTSLRDEGKIDLVSTHPSLTKHGIPSDFRFVLLDRRVNHNIELPLLEKLAINIYYYFKRIGIGDVTAYGLDSSLVTVEKIPLTIPSKSKTPIIKIRN
ncbi:MAG: KUP/HAK/KT family potassium transporter [Bacteroidales bacterium]|nr:KUP/HAK/KT family potassium transporter [Bacteroidales bacterium]